MGKIIIVLMVFPAFSKPLNLLPHEKWITGLYSQHKIDKPVDVFAKVFNSLADEVTIYPSENYYYFRFATNGSWYWGNFRLSHDVRDKGKIHFAYARHHDYSSLEYLLLGDKHGVTVEQLEAFIYSVKFNNKKVIFHLNNDPQHPPKGLKSFRGEEWIGRSTDESGFRFLLYFNSDMRHFYWVLDPDQAVEWKFTAVGSIFYHPDSAFAFYQDPIDKRLVLVGVNRWNIEANNYYDGPFDQLPDNILAKTKFSEYVQLAYPETRGYINKYGEFEDETRVGIIPYLSYDSPEELAEYVDACLIENKRRSQQYYCLFKDQTRIYDEDTEESEISSDPQNKEVLE